MHVIDGGKLRQYYKRAGREEAEQPLKAWHLEARQADWRAPADIAARYRSAVFFGQNLVAFAMVEGVHRLVTKINYPAGVVLVQFVGSAAEYASIWGKAVA
jgi:mRNA interferase HigB